MQTFFWIALTLVTLGQASVTASNATSASPLEDNLQTGETYTYTSSYQASGSEPQLSSSDTYNVYHSGAASSNTAVKNSDHKPSSKKCQTVEKPMPNFGNYDDGVKRVMTCYVCGDASGYGGFTENCNFSPSKETYSQSTSAHFLQTPYSSDYKMSPSSSYDDGYAPQATRDHNNYDKGGEEEQRYAGMTCKTVYKGNMKCKVCNKGSYGNAYSEDCGYDSVDPGQHRQNTYDYRNADQKSYKSPHRPYASGTENGGYSGPSHGDHYDSYADEPYGTHGYYSGSSPSKSSYDDNNYKEKDNYDDYKGDGGYKADGSNNYKGYDDGSYAGDDGYKAGDSSNYMGYDDGSYKGYGGYKGDAGYKGDDSKNYKGDDSGNYKDVSSYNDNGNYDNGDGNDYKSGGDYYSSAGSGNKKVAVTSPSSKEKKCETVYKPMSSFGPYATKGDEKMKMKCLVCARGDGYGGVTEECNYSSAGSYPGPTDMSTFFRPQRFRDFAESNSDPFYSFPF